ncbi:MAG: metallophosphoesterase family protein [Deltaproteobacteria bacterium]|nr:metallophosphoesterase family protein [Deltaproteobacteria bacterium]
MGNAIGDKAAKILAAVKGTASDGKKDTLLAKLGESLTVHELEAMLKSSQISRIAPTVMDWSDAYFKFGFMTDTHIGHAKFREDWLYRAYNLWEREKCEFVVHGGDISEGMSGRPGHVYELSEVGYHAQFRRARDLLRSCPIPIKAVAGNHDLWWLQKNDLGVLIGAELQDALGKEQFSYLGEHEGQLVLNGLSVTVWHGADGRAYAKSYRAQKIVESLRGGEKPHILLLGHTHDRVGLQVRNVQVVEGGTLSAQTSFMRYRTRSEIAPGVHIVEAWGKGTLERFRTEWVPFFD